MRSVVVLPQPVSPTNNTGSLFYKHLYNSTASRFNYLVKIIGGKFNSIGTD